MCRNDAVRNKWSQLKGLAKMSFRQSLTHRDLTQLNFFPSKSVRKLRIPPAKTTRRKRATKVLLLDFSIQREVPRKTINRWSPCPSKESARKRNKGLSNNKNITSQSILLNGAVLVNLSNSWKRIMITKQNNAPFFEISNWRHQILWIQYKVWIFLIKCYKYIE